MIRTSSATADIDKPLRAQSKAPDVYSKKRECVWDCKCNAICFDQTCHTNSVRNEERERLPTRSQNEIEFGGKCLKAFQWNIWLSEFDFLHQEVGQNSARCLDGVRGSRPLYTMIAWLLQTCTFQAKKCCFFKGRSPLFFSRNSQGMAIRYPFSLGSIMGCFWCSPQDLQLL